MSQGCRATRRSERKTRRLAAAPVHVGAGLRRQGDIEARGRTGEYPRPRRTQAYEAGRGLIAAGSWSAKFSGSIPTTTARVFCQKADSSSSAEPITKAVSATLGSTAPKVARKSTRLNYSH